MNDEVNLCESCNTMKHTRTAMVNGKYYKHICSRCIGESEADDGISSNAAGFDRRRNYEDNAQDTIQPYDANGKPRVEFYRLYPEAAGKVFSQEQINDLKRKI
jgi:hypothetical protein